MLVFSRARRGGGWSNDFMEGMGKKEGRGNCHDCSGSAIKESYVNIYDEKWVMAMR